MKQEESETLKLFDLKDDNLLDKIVNSITKVKGESNNKKIIILSCISKDLPIQYRDGLSLVISSKSSAGKSTIIDNCLMPFTKDVFPFTKITDSFFQRNFKNKSLDGKILHEEQLEKTNKIGQAILSIPKFQLSEGITRFGLSERDKDGKFTATTFECKGIPIYISSTTNPDIEPQELNRITLLQADESKQQTDLILESVLKEYSTNPDNIQDDNLDELTKLFEIFKTESKRVRKIYVPFENLIKEKFPKTLEIRRDIKKILNYTCVIAWLHHKNRKTIIVIEHEFTDMYAKTEPVNRYSIIAELDDFKECLEIGKDVFSQTLNKVNKSTKEIIELVKEIYPRTDKGVNSAEILKETDIRQNTVNDYLRQARTAGFLSVTKEGRENYYRPTKKELDIIKFSDIEYTEKDFDKWYNENFSDEKYKLIYPWIKRMSFQRY